LEPPVLNFSGTPSEPVRISVFEETTVKLKHLAPLTGALYLSGCVVGSVRTGPVQYESRTIERDGFQEVTVNLDMGAGDLKVGSGTSKLAQAYFTYNVPVWKPVVDYGNGNLTIRQPGGGHSHAGNVQYQWDVRLGREIPIDLRVNFGAGDAQLDLGSLDLRDVNVEMGVGRMIMDLRGDPTHDYTVHIQGGVGEAKVQLPLNAGVFATAQGGIGEISVRGMRKDGGHWVNEAYDTAKVKVRVDVQGGIGRIELIGDTE
jgi:hypothetical protein